MRADFFAAVHWRSEIPKIDKIHLTKKIHKYISEWGKIHWTIWTNMYNYQFIPIYLSLQWRNKNGWHFCSGPVEVGDSKNSMDHSSNELDPSLRSNCCRNQGDNNESSISHKKTASLTSSRKSDILEICNDWFIDGCCQPYSAILVFDKRLI